MIRGLVSVVGRPNVGKSTLFNKLIQSKEAITEDTPGVTRDRLYREAEWTGTKFMLVDTGGYESSEKDLMSVNIKKQVEFAIDSSDIILFVVDGRAGVLGDDREIANLLRRTDKKVIVAVNKIDTSHTPDSVYEFYELGFEDVLVISAEQSYGLGDLLDKIVENLPQKLEEIDDDALTVAIIGKPNVGKSSLLNRILGEDRMIVTDIAGTTRDAIDALVEVNGVKYNLIDTAGLRRKRSVEEGIERYSVIRTLSAIDRSDICLLLIDASEGVSEQDTKIAGYAHETGKAIIILVNKWDLIERSSGAMKAFTEQIRTRLSFIPYARVHYISVLTGMGLDEIFPIINQTNEYYNLRVATSSLNEVIAEAMMLREPPIQKGQRLKIFYATQRAVRPPTFTIFVNNYELLHFSYERYLENTLRQKYGFLGTPIKLEFRSRSS